ncbi:MAG: rRNA cytosine-C5-methylase [Rikenellaceae bacterium]|nr:rRNA cytosine-C5-methylase [uncultured Alistipes sp.]MDO5383787.1 rRNA cytosine-C5-methylase [Rikenellaceae bacterium]
MTLPLPELFRSRTTESLGTSEAERLFAALDNGESPVSIRFNPYKIGSQPEGRQVPWCRYGYYLDERPQFTLDPAFHGGAYYVQEASSMFLEAIFRQIFEPDAAPRILDLCAAPGGKTTLLSTLAGAEGLVVANEVIRQRASVLAANAVKWGIGNIVVTNNDPAHFAPFEHYFDLIAVDAPCSGEGMFRKDPAARTEWSEQGVKLCAARQRRILSDIWGSLRPGGILIYSTCTFNAAENEENIAWLCGEYDCEPVEIAVDPSWGVVKGETDRINTFRFYPHRVKGEGFFAAVIRKSDGRRRERTPKPRKAIFSALNRPETDILSQWVAQPEYMRFAKVNGTAYAYYREAFGAVRQISESLTVIHSGIPAGQLFGAKFKPEHALALFHDVSRETVPQAEFDLPQTLDYLRKNEIDPSLLQEGINMVCYNGLPLGWIKRIGGRCNNLYPKESRIAAL